MSIVTSTIVVEHAQRDGRRWVRETHVDHLGAAHIIGYLAAPTADHAAIATARAALIAEQLAEAEAAEVMGG